MNEMPALHLAAARPTIVCPRCAARSEERFYGPCVACRAELRASVAGVARQIEQEAFVPAMHVTPNAVALKE